MDKYTIYCTEEQTKKALELGAPLHTIIFKSVSAFKALKIIDSGNLKNNHTLLDNCQQSGDYCSKLITNPTAEQMIGWLEEKGVTVEIVKCETHWFARTYSHENTNFNKGRFFSRKGAILASIDSALDYLTKEEGEE